MKQLHKLPSPTIAEAIDCTIDFFADYPDHDEELIQKFIDLIKSFTRNNEYKKDLLESLALHWVMDVKKLSKYSDEQIIRLAVNSVSNLSVKLNFKNYLNYGSF